jgi:hypothetical protein
MTMSNPAKSLPHRCSGKAATSHATAAMTPVQHRKPKYSARNGNSASCAATTVFVIIPSAKLPPGPVPNILMMSATKAG